MGKYKEAERQKERKNEDKEHIISSHTGFQKEEGKVTKILLLNNMLELLLHNQRLKSEKRIISPLKRL